MTYKGSVVVKRTHLLNMIENMKTMFRSDADDTSKWHIWGQQIGYERILENDLSDYNWNEFMKYIWDRPWTAGTKPYEMFEWIEGSEFTPKGE